VFELIGRFSVKFRWLIIIVWVVAIPVVVKNLPSLASVSQSNNQQFLPANSPTTKAANLAAPFEGKSSAATAVLVGSSTSGPLTPAQNAAITAAEAAVKNVSGVGLVRDQGTSKDGQAREALIGISGAAFGTGAQTSVNNLRAAIDKEKIPGLDLNLTGQLPESVDQDAQSSKGQNDTQLFSIIFIVILLLIVYKSLLAPFVTLLPAAFSLIIAQPVIAETTKAGLQISPITQILLIVLMLGAGTDYGIFLVFRVREELRRGHDPKEAVRRAVAKVGVSITFSALTVAAALLSLLLASFGIYKGLGPALAIGLGIMLLAALTLLPALLSILGRAVFWPSRVRGGEKVIGFWGALADRVIKRPALMLLVGLVIFGGLSLGVIGYRTSGFASSGGPPSGTDSARGAAVIASHFPATTTNSDSIFMQFNSPVWSSISKVVQAQSQLSASPVFKAVSGPVSRLTATQLYQIHQTLPVAAILLPPVPPQNLAISPQLYQAYRSSAQFISSDGKTVQFNVLLSAGDSGSTAALRATPQVREAITTVANNVGATQSGVYGIDSAGYDIDQISTSDLEHIIPIVLIIIGILLAILLRSLIAPLYLVVTVGLSYFASLGFAMIVFVHIGGDDGLNFVLPFLMFIFSMALGEDYNILVMSRIREEAHGKVTLKEAVAKAIGLTGSTVTSAGLVLAGTFAVLAIAGGGQGGGEQIKQIGYGIAFGILLDTLFVRTLLVPSIVVLLDRWNWWPSKLWRYPSGVKR
jgi:RND superfamily putative drug exporter